MRRLVTIKLPGTRAATGLVLIAGLIAGAIIAVLASSGMIRAAEATDTIAEEIERLEEAGGGRFRLGEVTLFDWDRVHIFAPYTPQDSIEQSLGFASPAIGRTAIEDRDDITLLVFMNKDEPVRIVAFPRDRGDFANAAAPSGLPQDKAVFRVEPDPQYPDWPLIRLAPPSPPP